MEIKEGQLFRTKLIKIEDDLPKGKGFYFIHWKHPDERIPSQMSIAYFNPETKGIWLDYDWYDWYLQPIEEQELISFKEPEFDEQTAKKVTEAFELAKQKSGKKEQEAKPLTDEEIHQWAYKYYSTNILYAEVAKVSAKWMREHYKKRTIHGNNKKENV